MSSKGKRVAKEVFNRRLETVAQVLTLMEQEAKQKSLFGRIKIALRYVIKKDFRAFFEVKQMAKALYKIISQNEHCVLLNLKAENNVFKVIDIENDVIAMGSYEHCKKAYDEYDINEVRKERKRSFESWLREFVDY